MDSQGLAAIHMGFKGFHMGVAAIYTGFQVVLLKTHANMVQSLHRALKTNAYGNNNIAKVPHSLAWSHIASIWIHLDSLGLTGLTESHLGSIGLARTCCYSHGF